MARMMVVVSTAYCLTGTMADGSYTREGSVASNHYPLGTLLQIRPSPTRRRLWTVRDRIGWGTELDFWRPSCHSALQWGRRIVRIRRVVLSMKLERRRWCCRWPTFRPSSPPHHSPS